MAVVRLDRVTKRYERTGTPAVDDVSMTINDGEFMVLLGPSGCGKSTTLRMIAGLESITSGSLTIDGAPMNSVPAKDRDIAMVFQSYALYPHMSVRDNLAFGLRRRRFPKEEIRRRVDGAAGMLGLMPLLDRKPHALSGGQRQRVALGRAIVRDPKVFLFDEPLSNLDAALRAHTRAELMKQYHRLGATMIYVTHDQIEAMTMGTRICVMNHGRIVQVGRPLDVYCDPADTFVASFIGSPPTNLIPGEVAADGDGLAVRIAGPEIAVPGYTESDLADLGGRQVVVGIRPEDMYLASPEAGESRRFASLRAKAASVEPLGAETLVTLALPGLGEGVIARVGREWRVDPGQAVTVTLDLDAIHLFDPTSGKALPRSGSWDRDRIRHPHAIGQAQP